MAHPDIPYGIMEMQFADKWEAFDWMYRNQLGRRSLTEEQRAYLIGKLYEAQKHMHGGDRRSKQSSTGQNVRLKTKKEIRDGTAGVIGKEYGITPRSVTRAEYYAKGIDVIREQEPELANQILTAQKKASKASIQTIAKAKEEDMPSMIEELKKGKPRNLPTCLQTITTPHAAQTGSRHRIRAGTMGERHMKKDRFGTIPGWFSRIPQPSSGI